MPNVDMETLFEILRGVCIRDLNILIKKQRCSDKFGGSFVCARKKISEWKSLKPNKSPESNSTNEAN